MELTLETANTVVKEQQWRTKEKCRAQRKAGKDKFTGQRNVRKTTTCYSCVGSYPHPQDKPCLAKGKVCRACNKLNHFAKYCKTTAKQLRKQQEQNVNDVDTQPTPRREDSSTDYEYSFVIHKQQNINTAKKDTSEDHKKLPKNTVKFRSTEIRMLIDSGASVNILDKTAYRLLSRKLPSIKL